VLGGKEYDLEAKSTLNTNIWFLPAWLLKDSAKFISRIPEGKR
jgi:hypothetical protein